MPQGAQASPLGMGAAEDEGTGVGVGVGAGGGGGGGAGGSPGGGGAGGGAAEDDGTGGGVGVGAGGGGGGGGGAGGSPGCGGAGGKRRAAGGGAAGRRPAKAARGAEVAHEPARAEPAASVPLSTRTAARARLLAAFAGEVAWLADGGESLACGIEKALHEAAVTAEDAGRRGGGAPGWYSARCRSLLASLRRNPSLRERILDDEVGARELVRAPPEELARGSAAGDERERLREKALRRATVDTAEGAHATTEHTCPVCGAADAGYVYVGGSRDIRKAEVWGTNADESVTIKIECKRCRHTWTKDAS